MENTDLTQVENVGFEINVKPDSGKGGLFAALSKFQGECSQPKKDTLVSYEYNGKKTKYLYATLDNCISANQKLLAECGLAVAQFPTVEGLRVGMITILSHTSGEFIRNNYSMKLTSEKPQDVGSIITYLRRYTYCPALGLASEFDEDGEKANGDKAVGGKLKVENQAPAEKRTLTKNVINKRFKDCKTLDEAAKVWALLTKVQQDNPEIKAWKDMRKIQLEDAAKELEKQTKGKPNNEAAAELLKPDETPDAIKFINTIRKIETKERLTKFYETYKEAIMKLPAEQYQMVSKELDALEAKFNN